MSLCRKGSNGSKTKLVTGHVEDSVEGKKKEEKTNVIKHKEVGLPQVVFKVIGQFLSEEVIAAI